MKKKNTTIVQEKLVQINKYTKTKAWFIKSYLTELTDPIISIECYTKNENVTGSTRHNKLMQLPIDTDAYTFIMKLYFPGNNIPINKIWLRLIINSQIIMTITIKLKKVSKGIYMYNSKKSKLVVNILYNPSNSLLNKYCDCINIVDSDSDSD